MRHRAAFADLSEAVLWLKDHWTEREIPVRLHDHAYEGWGPYFTPAFNRYLDARPSDTSMQASARTCSHPRLRGRDEWDCPDCLGAGVYTGSTVAYRYPTWRAMDKLSAWDRSHPANPTSSEVVLTLVINSFDVQGTLRVMGIGEPTVFLAIRRLHERYEYAPVKVGWASKSESQRSAEEGMVSA